MMKHQLFYIQMAILLIASALLAPACAQQVPVTLTMGKSAGHDVVILKNYRVTLTIDPTHGGAVTSYSDNLAPAELILQKPYQGLCMDHFQEQNWPGEFLETAYDYKVVQDTPREAQVLVSRKAKGVWPANTLVNAKLSDILLEKTYTLRADSPTLVCKVKLTAPADQAKVFSYWLQNVMFAGGDYDAATDRTFRPTARGIRNCAAENNGMYGKEEWLRDFTGGWMALIDTKKKTGLAMVSDYNDLRISYACGGNLTNELMFSTLYLPKGQSREYVINLTPLVGLDRVLYTGTEMNVSATIRTDNKGNGNVDFLAERSALSVADAKFTVKVFSPATGKEIDAGMVSFDALTDKPQTRALALVNLPPDPIVLRVTASGHDAAGAAFTAKFEDFHAGAYQWGDNIQTDMRSPVYAAERPAQKLSLAKPAQLLRKREYGGRYLFMQGLLDENYQIAGALHTAGWSAKTDVISYSYDGSWYGALSDFPYDYDQLFSYDTIILGGVSKSGLKPIGLEMLHDYLLAGGGMIVLGSHGAYGRSQLKGTKLGDALPVEISDKLFDLSLTGGKRVTLGPDTLPFIKYTSLADTASCYFLHDVTLKPGAKVLMQVDGKPFMVAGEYGPKNARIVCILGAPMGNPGKGQTAFWQDPGWYWILRNAVYWVSGYRDQRFEE
ncbi:MAG TPA: hypothetical protein VGM23_08430, partial [Armatimonadota bacterium]|jgi:uncharacterized membrane protein